jgi:hypothetical protein
LDFDPICHPSSPFEQAEMRKVAIIAIYDLRKSISIKDYSHKQETALKLITTMKILF